MIPKLLSSKINHSAVFVSLPTDIDECSVNEDICNNGLCVNEDGGFLCICPARSAFDYNTMFCVPTGRI